MPCADAGVRPTLVSAAAGRMRVHAVSFRHDAERAAAIEEMVVEVVGVRAVRAYPRTASVVVWYAPEACDTAEILSAIARTEHIDATSAGERQFRHPDARSRTSVVSKIVGGLVRSLSNPRADALDTPPEIKRLHAALDRIGGNYLGPVIAGHKAPSKDIQHEIPTRSRWMWLALPPGIVAMGFTGVAIRRLLRWTAHFGTHSARSRAVRIRRPTSPLSALATSALAVPSWGGVGVSLLLVTVAGAIAYRQRLSLTRELVVSCARAAVQLVTAGALLRILFQRTSLLGAAGWIILMTTVAGQVAGRRAPGLRNARVFATGGVAASTGVTLAALLAGRVITAETRVIVPVGGMIVSSAMLAAGSALRRLGDEVRQSRPAIETRLSLGQSGPQAISPYRRSALRTALIPAIDSTKVVGLISLPGAMTGLILAGTSPLTAIRYQIVVMYMQLAAIALAARVTLFLAEGSLFDDAVRLNYMNLPDDS